jgi:hypothetical protein
MLRSDGTTAAGAGVLVFPPQAMSIKPTTVNTGNDRTNFM